MQELTISTVQLGTLLLKTIFCSICGIELKYINGSLDNLLGFELCTGGILGHEWVACFAALGQGVKGWLVGGLVARGSTKRTCGERHFSRHGFYHLCLGGPSNGLILVS